MATAHGLAVVSPGPDFVVVTRQTLAHGRGAGLRTAWGVACAIGIHVGYSLFGLAWAIQQYPPLLNLLRWLGAALLLWIGWNALRARPAGGEDVAPQVRAAGRDFGIGLLTNALNVKAMLFFVALGSAVLSAGAAVPLRLILGGWMILATGAWFSFLAWTLGHPQVRGRLRAWSHWIERVMGAILLLLGAIVLLESLSR